MFNVAIYNPRIVHHCCNLRTPDWTQVDYRQLRELISQDMASGEDQWTFHRWQRHPEFGTRSYLITSQGGALYALFIHRKENPL